MITALWLLACGTSPLVAPEHPPVQVDVWLDGTPKGGGGALVVQTTFNVEGEVSAPVPVATGLTFVEDGPPQMDRAGQDQVVRQRYVFRGGEGFYEVPPLLVTWTGPDGEQVEGQGPSLFFELDVPAPELGELEDIVEPAAVWTVPWAPLGAVGGVGLLFAGGLWFAFRPRGGQVGPEAPPEPPDVVALRAWEAALADMDLDDEAKALALSQLFRDYLEAVLGFEATARTTKEIVDRLQGLSHLPEGNVPRAKRLLRATDRVKYAEQRPGQSLFDSLDADLRSFVGSTRPAAWRGEGEAP